MVTFSHASRSLSSFNNYLNPKEQRKQPKIISAPRRISKSSINNNALLIQSNYFQPESPKSFQNSIQQKLAELEKETHELQQHNHKLQKVMRQHSLAIPFDLYQTYQRQILPSSHCNNSAQNQKQSSISSRASKEIILKQKNSKIRHIPRLINYNYSLETPPHSDIDPSEHDHEIPIEDIVSNAGIDSEVTITCFDKFKRSCKKLNNILPKLTFGLNTFRKVMALWITGYIDKGHYNA